MAARSVIPGTVHLVDLQGTLAVKHAGGNLDDVVLVPAPSNDPDDPLNWSPRRKLLSTVSLVVYLLMIGLAVSCVYSIIVPISQDTGLTVAGNQSIDIRHRKDADLRLRSQFWNWLSISIDGLGLLAMVNLSPSGQVSHQPETNPLDQAAYSSNIRQTTRLPSIAIAIHRERSLLHSGTTTRLIDDAGHNCICSLRQDCRLLVGAQGASRTFGSPQ